MDYYRAALAPKQVWKIAEASHVRGFGARPREYERHVVGFFDRALLGGRGGANDIPSDQRRRT